jgi:hypothetical protein
MLRGQDVMVEGESGILHDDCHVFTGFHAFNSRVNKDWRGARSARVRRTVCS